MRVAVVQHRLRPTLAEDRAALEASVGAAVARGAEVVVVPSPVTGEHAAWVAVARAAADGVPVVCPSAEAWPEGAAPLEGAEALGPIVAIAGDACFDPSLWSAALGWEPTGAVLSPYSENDLQAEAALETAIALSDALCGLVIVADCAGAELGEAGHGGSAIVLFGDVMAEALGDEDVLVADVALPVAQPEPREAFPKVPTILAQRIAHHAGRRLDMGYLADLSDGGGDR